MPAIKSFTICLLMLISVLQLNAQTKIWITGGINFSDAKIKRMYYPETASQPAKTGFHAGAVVTIPVGTLFSIEPGLEYITKGYHYNTSVPITGTANTAPLEYITKQDMKPSFLQLPLHFVYKPHIGQNALFIGAGPYIAYGIGGTGKNYSYYTDGTQVGNSSAKLKFKHDLGQPMENYLYSAAATYSYNASDIIYSQPLDVGISTLLGFELHRNYRIQLNSQIGLKNVAAPYKGQEKQSVLKNRSFGVSLGYRF